MKNAPVLVLIIAVLVSGCAAPSGKYAQESWAKTNYSEAKTDCQVKATVATGRDVPESAYIKYNRAHHEFMHECMAGQGYTWTKD